jgi:hypothetical protein
MTPRKYRTSLKDEADAAKKTAAILNIQGPDHAKAVSTFLTDMGKIRDQMDLNEMGDGT